MVDAKYEYNGQTAAGFTCMINFPTMENQELRTYAFFNRELYD
jgi:hypothetical protein